MGTAASQLRKTFPRMGSQKSLLLGAFIFMIISVVMGCSFLIFTLTADQTTAHLILGDYEVEQFFSFISLFWSVPMTIVSWFIYKGTRPNTIAFGVCALLFVNLISGILFLCASKDK